MACDGTGLNPQLSGGSTSKIFGSSSPSITRRQLLRYIDEFTVIDIREDVEVKADNEEKDYVANLRYIAMGRVLSSAFERTDEGKALLSNGRKLCFVCPRGGRAKIVADSLMSAGVNVTPYYLKGGLLEFREQQKGKVVTDDDFLMILTILEKDPEKVGLGLQLCLAAANKGKTATLVLMGEATRLATKSYAANNKLELPKVFKPWSEMLSALISKQVNIYCCTTCLKARNTPTEDLIEQSKPVRGPDIIDMKEFCKMNMML